MAKPPQNPGPPRKSTKTGATSAPRSGKSRGPAVSAAPAPAADPDSTGAPSAGFEAPAPAERAAMIAAAAYYRAERRGFAPGHEQEDWLAAEREVDAALAPSPPPRAAGAATDAQHGSPN